MTLKTFNFEKKLETQKTVLWIEANGQMRKLNQIQVARLVKQKNDDWYIVWYNQNPPQRFRQKFGLNRIKDIDLRQTWADAILGFINSAALTGAALQPSDIEKKFKPSAHGSPLGDVVTFSEHVTRFIELRENVLEHGTVKVFKTCFNNLNLFAIAKLKKNAVDFQDFDIDFPLKFQSWCYAPPRKHSRNYVAKLFDVIRQFLRDAEEHDIDAGKAWKTSKYVIGRTQVDEISLSLAEVEKLYRLDVSKNLQEIKDLFVLACLTGLRFSDVTRVNQSNIIQLKNKSIKALKIDTIKTGEKVIVPLHPFAVAILDRLIERKGIKPPCNQVFNRALKDLGKLAAITEGVSLRVNIGGKQKIDTKAKYHFMTTHTARRSFATIAYMEYKIPAALIMKITGHRTEKEFFRYIRISQEQAAIDMWSYMTKE